MIHIEKSDFEARFLQKLNPQQRDAVQTIDGNILLLATPGSGKTTVLVTRLGFMVCCQGINPENILTMTYTRAATRDMKERFVGLFGEEAAAGLQFRTINGVSAKIIEAASSHRGQKAFTLQDNEAELSSMIRRIYQSINKEFAEDSVVKEIRAEISYIKNMMLADEEVDSLQSSIEHLPDIYRQYQAELRKQRLMDYDDQMVYALALLRKMPDVLNRFQEQFRYVCVDEAQDTSKIQHEIIKLLASKHGNLFMVGDEDQSIYGFRAAYPEALLNFESDHPGARVLLMEENYRSTPEIIDLANQFISQNPSRHEKTIKETRSKGSPVRIIHCKNREGQYLPLLETARNCEIETAILFRNNDSALPLIDLFEKNGIAYNCRNMDDIFFTNRVVVDILEILRFAYEPANSELFMRLYYKFGAPISKKLAAETVHRSAKSGKPIFEELVHVPDVKGYVQDIVIELMGNLPLIKSDSAETAIRRIWEAMHYGSNAEQKGFDTGKYFILCQLAKDVTSSSAFIEKLESLRRIIASHVNSENNKVILSTIHSSKGLEYERVFLLDIADGIIPSKEESSVKTAEEWIIYEEERRLYYVGMTRAKNDLYLFDFLAKSSFTSESRVYLPVPSIDEGDIFSFLQSPQIGKSYSDKEWGKGEIEAQCDDLFYLRFGDGILRCMQLEEMIRRRDRSTTYRKTSSKNKRKGKKSKNLVRQEKQPKGIVLASVGHEMYKAGTTVYHESFGKGVIQDITGGIVAIRFSDKKMRKFILQECIDKGLLSL